MKSYSIIASLLILFNILSADVSIEIQNVNTEYGTLDIYMENDVQIAGFQFNVDGVTITGAYGGTAEAEGFLIESSTTTVIGFSLEGNTIPIGEEVLIQVSFSGYGGGGDLFW